MLVSVSIGVEKCEYSLRLGVFKAPLTCNVSVHVFFHLKLDSHVTFVFAFSFDLCHHFLDNANVKCKHIHLLPWNPFFNFDGNKNADVTCEETFNQCCQISIPRMFNQPAKRTVYSRMLFQSVRIADIRTVKSIIYC